MAFKFSRDQFFASFRTAFGPLNATQVSGLNDLLNQIENDISITDIRHFAYMLERGQRHEVPDGPISSLGWHVIRSAQPLLINENLEEVSASLGSYTLQGTAAETDAAKRVGLIHQAQRIHNGEFGHIPLYHIMIPWATRQGITLLYMVPWPQSGLYSNTALTALEQLRGTKFRTFNAMTQRFATLIGAIPTLVQVPELPQAFATGVVNAMVTSAATGVDSQAWDFVKQFVPVGFTRTKNAVFVNTRALQGLPAEVQAAIKAAATKAEETGWVLAQKEEADKQATLAARGMTVTDPAPAALMAELVKVGDTLATEWIAKAGEDGAKLVAEYKAAIGRA